LIAGILLDCETFFVEVQEVAACKKVNLLRLVGDTEKVIDGLQITLRSGRQIEVDYLNVAHRDQVYDALFDAKAKFKELVG